MRLLVCANWKIQRLRKANAAKGKGLISIRIRIGEHSGRDEARRS